MKTGQLSYPLHFSLGILIAICSWLRIKNRKMDKYGLLNRDQDRGICTYTQYFSYIIRTYQKLSPRLLPKLSMK